MLKTKEKPASVVAETDCKGDVGSFAHSLTLYQNYDISIISQSQKKSSVFYENLFNAVKNSLDIVNIIEYYGFEINSKGFARCPFHQDNTPSFKINSATNTFHCFGCGEHGTVIDFVMKLFGLTNIEAERKLNEDFRLNLLRNKPVRTAKCRSLQENKNLINDFKEWERQAFIAVSSYFKALRFWGEQIFIYECEYFNKYLSDVENIVFVEALVDLMIENTNDFTAQVEFYRTFGEAVTEIERKLN